MCALRRATGFPLDDLTVAHCCAAWTRLVDQPWLLMSIGLCEWAHGFSSPRLGISRSYWKTRSVIPKMFCSKPHHWAGNLKPVLLGSFIHDCRSSRFKLTADEPECCRISNRNDHRAACGRSDKGPYAQHVWILPMLCSLAEVRSSPTLVESGYGTSAASHPLR